MKKFAILLVAVSMLHGCAGFLDTVPVDKASPESFLTNTDQAKSMLAGIYWCFYDDGPIYLTPYQYENMCDNSYNQHPWEESAAFAKGTQTSASWWAEYKWSKDWLGISRSNSLIGSLAGIADISADDKADIIAEARFLRAYFYFDLIRFYGRVPLLDENSPQENAPREDLDKVIAFIKSDIAAAIERLDDLKGGQRANLAAAYMLKMQLAQYEYDNATVIECCEAIKGMGFSLYPDYKKLFTDEGMNDPANNEVIFKVNYMSDFQYAPSGQGSYLTQIFYIYGSFNVTLSMVDSYFTINGLPIKELIADDGSSIPADPDYNPDDPCSNRDPRLKMSILCPGDEYRQDAESKYQGHFQPQNWDNKTGFWVKKFVDESLTNFGNDPTDKIYMRYGEVLLAWAEAENELNGPKGAYPMIDELRKRVGMVTLTESLPNLTQSQMRELIRNERRVELFVEGQRWFDIRRWKIAEKVMTDAYGYDVSKLVVYPSVGTVSEDWQYVPIVVDQRNFNKERDYLWPIPQVELNSNPLIQGDQNYGY